jgi:hypothetical protein
MRLALVTTPPSVPSGIGELARGLLERLKPRAEVRVFVEDRLAGEPICDLAGEPALALFPREHDRVLYLLGNEPAHAFMVPLLRAIGGAVWLHDWCLFDLAAAFRPALARGGLAGQRAALLEGGVAQLWAYRADRLDRARLPLNRSVVRFADAFLVEDEELRRRILEERNAPTPIAVVPRPPSGAGESAGASAWELAAARCAEALERFPRPRGHKRRLIGRRLRLARLARP